MFVIAMVLLQLNSEVAVAIGSTFNSVFVGRSMADEPDFVDDDYDWGAYREKRMRELTQS